MSDPDLTSLERPPYRLLAAVCALLCGPPLWAAAASGGVGGFRMFTRPSWVRLRIDVVTGDGRARTLSAAELSPHLGRDARRIVVPALHGTAGETALELMAQGLPDFARLACELSGASRAHVQLERANLHGARPTLTLSSECTSRVR